MASFNLMGCCGEIAAVVWRPLSRLIWLRLPGLLAAGLLFPLIAMAAPVTEPAVPVADSGTLSESVALTAQAQKYENAEGVPRDYARAVELYCAAAKLGYADAQYALGWMYANGRGVPRNDEIAAQLFQVAAEQGHVQAKELTQFVPSQTLALPSCLLEEAIVVEDHSEAAVPISYPKAITKLVDKLAPHYRIDPQLVMAVIAVESGFNVKAVSPKNAQGLMQLTPETAQRFRVKDTFDAEDNIKGGIAYLQWLLAYFKGNVSLVAAAYNAGERAVEKYRGVPPYLETIEYVKKISSRYGKAHHAFQRKITEPSPVVMR
ncbi:transglycosylase SLT domain-containing protein [Undibacterium sp.]|jgi:soluble lytic murein transglycosylase-like protein|uniref:transglycosylase SLT domain-containing protein n=1 Tax=Undibacterium sp. TaxID=1914977 RepID=UPI002BEC1E00|nr:transglycosylase SLT domain-containing protein [Undibacterium sp.]HTD04490.1 transglycosylase SLT domain-containing protein [Undibacterium sp.]